jgi:putative FmdB family regulatory protein
MPTYSYECQKCGKIQDEFHSITANPRIKCNKCGGACKRKLGKGSGIIFKGSGFYETDYKRAGARSGGEAKSESAGGEKAAESKSESKTET